MLPMKKAIAGLISLLFLIPSVSSAAGLTYQQASALIVLLEAFGVNQSTISTVWSIVQPEDTPFTPPVFATTQEVAPPQNPLPNQNPIYGAPISPAPLAPMVSVISDTTFMSEVRAANAGSGIIAAFDVNTQNAAKPELMSVEFCANSQDGTPISVSRLFIRGVQIGPTRDIPSCSNTTSNNDLTYNLGGQPLTSGNNQFWFTSTPTTTIPVQIREVVIKDATTGLYATSTGFVEGNN